MSPTVRPGISLIEVLISIGVLAIGLLGVSALIPVAGHQAQEGIRNSRIAETGRRAFRELETEGLLRPATWRTVNTLGAMQESQSTIFRTAAIPASQYSFPLALCLDPRVFGLQARSGSAGPNFNPFFAAGFAGGGATVPPIPYLTAYLRRTGPAGDPVVLNAVQVSSQMEELFVSQDEVGFEINDASKAPPVSEVLKDVTLSSSDPQAFLKRNTLGRYSWMVFLSPQTATPVRNGVPYRGGYDVSVVVFEDRQKYEGESQVVLPVTRFSGLGGGTLQIRPLPPEFDRDLYKKGHWILIVGSVTGRTPDNIPYPVVDYRWYQIRAVDWSGSPVITVQGPDWRMPIPPVGTQQFGAPRPAVWAVFVPRVVNVYTKTMSLEM